MYNYHDIQDTRVSEIVCPRVCCRAEEGAASRGAGGQDLQSYLMLTSECATCMRKNPNLVASCSALELSVTAQLHLGQQKHHHGWIWRAVSRPVVWCKVNPNHVSQYPGSFFWNLLPCVVLDRAKHKRDLGAGEVQDWSMKVQACVWEMVLPWTFLRK